MDGFWEYQTFVEPPKPKCSPLETDAVWLAVFLGVIIVAAGCWFAWNSWKTQGGR